MRLLALLLLLAGCAHDRDIIPTDTAYAFVRVQWVMDTDKACRSEGVNIKANIGGCAVVSETPCRMVVARPSSWNDTYRLAAVGEEFLHCLGWAHGA